MELKIVFEDDCECIITNFKGKISFNSLFDLLPKNKQKQSKEDFITLKNIIFTEEDYVDLKCYGCLEINLKKRLELFNDLLYITINKGPKIYPFWIGDKKNKLQMQLKNNIVEWSI